MRIIKPARIRDFCKRHPGAAGGLERWLAFATAAEWRSFADVRKIFRSADEVKVESGRAVVIFNIGGNAFRLIAAVHYNRALVFVLVFLTHAEYSKGTWKDQL